MEDGTVETKVRYINSSCRSEDAEISLPECRNCEEPICMAACPAGAVRKDPETGRIENDEERCVGCNMCVMLCPFGAVKHTGDKSTGNGTAIVPTHSPSAETVEYEKTAKTQREKRRTLASRLDLSCEWGSSRTENRTELEAENE